MRRLSSMSKYASIPTLRVSIKVQPQAHDATQRPQSQAQDGGPDLAFRDALNSSPRAKTVLDLLKHSLSLMSTGCVRMIVLEMMSTISTRTTCRERRLLNRTSRITCHARQRQASTEGTRGACAVRSTSPKTPREESISGRKFVSFNPGRPHPKTKGSGLEVD